MYDLKSLQDRLGRRAMMCNLFSSGTIYLILTPVNGNCGIPRLYGRLLTGELGVDVDSSSEIYVIFSTSNRKTLLILHVDNYGVDLTKRRLHRGKFRTLLRKPQQIQTLTRQELLRLVLDGTYAEEWQNPELQAQMEAFYKAKSMPKI